MCEDPLQWCWGSWNTTDFLKQFVLNILWYPLGENKDGGPRWRTGSIFSCSKWRWDCLEIKPITTKQQSVFRLVSQSWRMSGMPEYHRTHSEERRTTIRYDTIVEFNVDSKTKYSALSSTRSQKNKLKQTTPVPLWYSTGYADYRRTITIHCRASLDFTKPSLALAVTAASHPPLAFKVRTVSLFNSETFGLILRIK